jgi:hypothetical protein
MKGCHHHENLSTPKKTNNIAPPPESEWLFPLLDLCIGQSTLGDSNGKYTHVLTKQVISVVDYFIVT